MLDLMRLYIQVVDEQSFTVVARKLGISQPAVSNQMRALEEKLGVKLLYRKGKGFATTQEGEITYRHAKQILDQWTALLKDVGHSERQMSGKVHIGASHIPGEYLLPSKLATFQKMYPEIKFKLTIGDSLEMTEKVLAQEVDFAIIGSVFDTDQLTSEFWLKDRLQLVVSPEHPLGKLQHLELHQLKDHPMILRESGSGHRRALEQALAKQELCFDDFNISLEVGSTEAVKNAVRSGMGYSFLSEHAKDPGDDQRVSWKYVDHFEIERSFYLLSRRNKPLTYIAETCYQFLMSSSG